MPHQQIATLTSHLMLVGVAIAICLFGSWIGMRHFARARATEGPTRYGWLFMASVGTGAVLWASTYLSILALRPSLDSGFDLVPTAATLPITIIVCLLGFEIGSRPRPALAPELGGLVLGSGVLATHYVALSSWHIAGTVFCNAYGVAMTLVLGFGLGALAVNRANRPVTRWCRHGAAIVLTCMILAMHLALAGTLSVIPDPSLALGSELLPAKMLGLGVVGAVLLVIGSGFSSYVIDLRARTESSDRIHQLSFNDTMTGLPNRIAFNERLAFDIAEAHERAHKLAAFSIDIDGFKDVNEMFGHICMYSPEMDDTARTRRALARDLQSAAAGNQLALHYQLQMSLHDGGIRGAEALMRWQHPKRGMISPAEFIPLAEETGAIVAIGEWALRTACADAAAGRIPGTVAVNLSPLQFCKEDLAESIHAILLQTGLSPRRLEVEVTESTIMADQARGLRILRRLKAMGISVAMDDFGTGYSSLGTLHAFPFDQIKLDQSFVKRLPNDAAAAAIVRTVLALGESLGIPILAEGIETEAQWQFLAREGCAKGQGYLFARPVALTKLPDAIEAAARFAGADAPLAAASQRALAS